MAKHADPAKASEEKVLQSLAEQNAQGKKIPIPPTPQHRRKKETFPRFK